MRPLIIKLNRTVELVNGHESISWMWHTTTRKTCTQFFAPVASASSKLKDNKIDTHSQTGGNNHLFTLILLHVIFSTVNTCQSTFWTMSLAKTKSISVRIIAGLCSKWAVPPAPCQPRYWCTESHDPHECWAIWWAIWMGYLLLSHYDGWWEL